MGLKGRFNETARADDHLLSEARYSVARCNGDRIVDQDEPALLALNECLRDSYAIDCARGVAKWNRTIKAAGIDFELTLPHRGFHRAIGDWAAVKAAPDGSIISAEEWERCRDQWLPTDAERAFVGSLMQGVTAPGKFAGWIAPPARGINHQPLDFDYVRL